MNLNSIHMELARDRENPEGNAHRGYEFTAALTPDGHLDPEAWKAAPERFTVTRFWDGERTALGTLTYRKGEWVFDYDFEADDDDEPGYRFAQHVFREGEYVSIDEPGLGLRTFKIVSVRQAV